MEVKSIVITPYQIIEKGKNLTLMVSHKGEYKKISDGEILMKDFNKGDYVFQSKLTGSGIVQYNYIKMNQREIKKYFPEQEEPRDFFTDPKYEKFFKKTE